MKEAWGGGGALMGGRGGGFAFVVEFNMARIDEAAFFGVAFEFVAVAWGTANCPRAREADQEQERDQVQGGVGANGFEEWLILTSSAVVSALDVMEPKEVGYAL